MDCADRIAEMMLDLETRSEVSEPMIICPTHGRAGKVRVREVIPDIALCVAKSQKPLYEEHYPDAEYIVHPDEMIGMAPKRQWIYDRFGDVFMLDDDIVAMRDVTVRAGEDGVVTDPQTARDLIARLFDQGRQMGAYLLGFNNFAHPAAYRPHYPFGLTGSVAGRAIGLRAGSKLSIPNKRILLTDDMYVSALNAYLHRYCLRDDRYVFYAAGCWANAGGMAEHRTWGGMLENNKFLEEMFGEAIQKKTGTAIAGIANDAQVKLKVPW
jgi:hypothetical protein